MPSDAELLAAYREGKARGLTRRQLADQLGLSPKSVNGRINRAARIEAEHLRTENEELRSLLAQMDADMYEPSAKDINDWQKWEDFINHKANTDGTLTILQWPDMHKPDEDMQVEELGLQMADVLQPDMHLWNGDLFDFDILSLKFPRSHNRRRRDAFREVRRPWMRLLDRLDDITPDSKKVVTGGNHCRIRVQTLANANPMNGDSLIEDFLDVVRQDGRVWWPGWFDELFIGPLHIQHGDRTGKNAAKLSITDVGGTMSNAASHTHFPSWYINTAYAKNDDNLLVPDRYYVESVITPCMCHIYPHYAQDKQKSKWVNGMTVIHINLRDRDVHFQNRIFHKRKDGSLAVSFGEHFLVQPPLSKSVYIPYNQRTGSRLAG